MKKNVEVKNREMRRWEQRGTAKRISKRMMIAMLICSMMAGMVTGCGSKSDTAPTENTAPSYEEYPAETECTSEEVYYESTGACERDNVAYDMQATKDVARSENTNKYCEYVIEEDMEYYNSESYEKADENGFHVTYKQPLSTFSSSVDTASYANIRRMIEDGYSLRNIPKDAVRPEEFINYFSYDLNKPEKRDKFGVTTEVAKCPWNEDHELMFVGVTTEEINFREIPDSNFVFLIDVSGSMADKDKLPLLQQSFKELVENLGPRDTVSIVTYANGVNTVLKGVSAKNKKEIVETLEDLMAAGGTNGEGGIQRAYELAERYFIKGGNNRVILATDGDLNIGISDPDGLERLIETKRDSGVYLSVLGFGAGNIKDDNMERLANCGNGNYSYIDSVYEAKKVLVEEMGSNLVTVADDVKFQVEFNPANVSAYRLIGYENHMLADRDFYDESVDAGEIGAGHQVVALYEIIPEGASNGISLKYQDDEVGVEDIGRTEKNTKGNYADEYATVKISYKNPGENEANYLDYVVGTKDYERRGSENLKFAALVAEFAMILSDSDYVGNVSFDDILDEYKTLKDTDDYKEEFYYLVRQMAKRS